MLDASTNPAACQLGVLHLRMPGDPNTRWRSSPVAGSALAIRLPLAGSIRTAVAQPLTLSGRILFTLWPRDFSAAETASGMLALYGGVLFSGEALYAGPDMGTVEAALAIGRETAQTILAAGG
jgi:hypothetical protein